MIINVFDYSQKAMARETRIKKLVAHVIDSENASMPALNVIITNDADLRDLNQRFLKRRKPTNVIAFPMGEVNEIYVSSDQVRIEDDLYYFVVHGLLHLLGYEHESPHDERTMDERCRGYVTFILSNGDTGQR